MDTALAPDLRKRGVRAPWIEQHLDPVVLGGTADAGLALIGAFDRCLHETSPLFGVLEHFALCVERPRPELRPRRHSIERKLALERVDHRDGARKALAERFSSRCIDALEEREPVSPAVTDGV